MRWSRAAAQTATAGLVVGLAIPAVLTTAGRATAHDGGSSNCVTQHDWRHAKVGTRKSRVHAIFDTRGTFADGHAGGYTRRYRPCAWNGGTDLRLYIRYNGQTGRVAEKKVVQVV